MKIPSTTLKYRWAIRCSKMGTSKFKALKHFACEKAGNMFLFGSSKSFHDQYLDAGPQWEAFSREASELLRTVVEFGTIPKSKEPQVKSEMHAVLEYPVRSTAGGFGGVNLSPVRGFNLTKPRSDFLILKESLNFPMSFWSRARKKPAWSALKAGRREQHHHRQPEIARKNGDDGLERSEPSPSTLRDTLHMTRILGSK